MNLIPFFSSFLASKSNESTFDWNAVKQNPFAASSEVAKTAFSTKQSNNATAGYTGIVKRATDHCNKLYNLSTPYKCRKKGCTNQWGIDSFFTAKQYLHLHHYMDGKD